MLGEKEFSAAGILAASPAVTCNSVFICIGSIGGQRIHSLFTKVIVTFDYYMHFLKQPNLMGSVGTVVNNTVSYA